MKFSTLAMLACGVVAISACGTSGPSRFDDPEPIRALFSADTLMFTDFDADGDFSVSTAEIESGLVREFARADSNADGSVGPIEYQNWSNLILGGGQMPPYRLDFDRNVDNVITTEEFRNEILARAREYDSDESGGITRAEFVRTLNQTRAPRPVGPGPEMRTRRN